MDADETVLRPLPNNHEPWLKNAEQKLTKAIEVLHDLYSEIFQGKHTKQTMFFSLLRADTYMHAFIS